MKIGENTRFLFVDKLAFCLVKMILVSNTEEWEADLDHHPRWLRPGAQNRRRRSPTRRSPVRETFSYDHDVTATTTMKPPVVFSDQPTAGILAIVSGSSSVKLPIPFSHFVFFSSLSFFSFLHLSLWIYGHMYVSLSLTLSVTSNLYPVIRMDYWMAIWFCS